jgi:hypothetical protein
MTKELLEGSRKRHAFVDVALIVTTIALVLSIVVAATVVSIGMARAETLGGMAGSDGERLALGVFVALAIAASGGLTALVVRDGERPSRHD